MTERANAFNFFGPKSLVGPELKPGDPAPGFQLHGAKFAPVTMEQFRGKPLVISVVPSLDTGVCTKQTVRFNQEATALGDQVGFLTVSADLPFAQARWCGANDATTIVTASDHFDMSFGAAYGTLVRDLRIDSRAVFVVDGAGVVRYAEYVPVAGQEPDYEAVMAAVRQLL